VWSRILILSRSPVNPPFTNNVSAIESRIVELTLEHRDLDLAIAALIETPIHDQLQLKRFKKRKLLLKDQIAFLQSQLNPDILA
jgi:hypothetical protein